MPRLRALAADEIQRISVGDAPLPLLVVDDVFDDPCEVRQLALAGEYARDSTFSTGVRSWPAFDTTPLATLLRGALALPDDVPFEQTEIISYTEQPSMRTIHLHVPHVDRQISLIALVYLNEPSQCRGGTGLYRHRPSGLSYFPEVPDDRITRLMQQHGLRGSQDLDAHCRGTLAGFRIEAGLAAALGEPLDLLDDWELLHLVEMRFNRLVAYDPKLFHMPVLDGHDFGSTLDGSRLLLRMRLPVQDLERKERLWA